LCSKRFPAALLPLGAAMCYALVGVTARMMAGDDVPTPLINLYSTSSHFSGAVPAHHHRRVHAIEPVRRHLLAYGDGGFAGSAVSMLIAQPHSRAEQSGAI
jgi:hypothetical protein